MRPRSWLHRVARALPRRHHIRGSALHRLLGERVLESDLWRFRRESVAGGLAVGIFFGMTPTMGIQAIMAGLAALFLRVNIPVALAATLVSNPFTAPFLYTFEYQLGVRLLGHTTPEELAGYSGLIRGALRGSRPLLTGSLIAAGAAAILSYGVVMLSWRARRRRPGPRKPE